MTKKIIYLVLLALLIRLALVYFQFSGDVRNHIAWGESILSAGTNGFYSRHFSGFNDANYPPLTIFVFAIFRYLYQVGNHFLIWQNFNLKFLPSLLIPVFSSLNMQAAFLKLPAILADLGIGILLYRLSEKKNQLLLPFLYLFNPATIYVSAVWGQIEAIPIFFLLLSYFFLSGRRDKYFLSHLFFTLALLTKQTALWVFPVFLLFWLKKGNLRKLIWGLFFQLVFFVLFYLPFTSPLKSFSTYLATLSGSSTLISDQAFNLWYFLFGTNRVEDNTILLGLSVRLWSITILSLSGISICYWYQRQKTETATPKALFWLSLAAFFLQTRVHERHLAPAVVFLLITDYLKNWKILFYFLLSAYYMYNLFISLKLPFI